MLWDELVVVFGQEQKKLIGTVFSWLTYSLVTQLMADINTKSDNVVVMFFTVVLIIHIFLLIKVIIIVVEKNKVEHEPSLSDLMTLPLQQLKFMVDTACTAMAQSISILLSVILVLIIPMQSNEEDTVSIYIKLPIAILALGWFWIAAYSIQGYV
jgi:hypothetical protein